MNFEYTLTVSRRARSLRISVGASGTVKVTRPIAMRESVMLGFLEKHEEWVLEQISKQKAKPQPLLARYSRQDYLLHKAKSLDLVRKLVAEMNSLYQFSYASISVGNQRSRWGSCSMRKNLNFNYKIIFLPRELQEYLIVHELCHLAELNHSARFWKLVAQTIPDWKNRRKELKKY